MLPRLLGGGAYNLSVGVQSPLKDLRANAPGRSLNGEAIPLIESAVFAVIKKFKNFRTAVILKADSFGAAASFYVLVLRNLLIKNSAIFAPLSARTSIAPQSLSVKTITRVSRYLGSEKRLSGNICFSIISLSSADT